jgi:hypothetical protein
MIGRTYDAKRICKSFIFLDLKKLSNVKVHLPRFAPNGAIKDNFAAQPSLIKSQD